MGTAMADIVLPGVGVYTPETARLEGSADSLVTGSIKHSVKHLIVHVHHELSNLGLALSRDKFRQVEKLEIDFRKDAGTGVFKWALENFEPSNLESLEVRSVYPYTAYPWEVEVLRAMYKPLANARIDLFGIESEPGIPRYGEVIRNGDFWFRHTEGTVAVFSLYLPFMRKEIEALNPDRIIVDCDNHFHGPWLKNLKASSIILHNLGETDSATLFTLLDSLKCSSLRITTADHSLNHWRQAIKIRLANRGIKAKLDIGAGY